MPEFNNYTSRYTRTHFPWTRSDDNRLYHMLLAGYSHAQVAHRLSRYRKSVRARIEELSYESVIPARDKKRYMRCLQRDKSSRR